MRAQGISALAVVGSRVRGFVLALCCALSSWALPARAFHMTEARPAPAWFDRGVIYQIQPRAFSADGKLRSAAARLEHVRDCGATIVYLLPVFKMDALAEKDIWWSPRQIKSGFEEPKNQYCITDYFHVDEEYGTDADLRFFCDEAHRLGLKVIFDLVYLHCSVRNRIFDAIPDAGFRDAEGRLMKGPWRFPKINFASSAAREYLFTNITYLMAEFGADGFRCDVGDSVPLDFWIEAHSRMNAIRPDDCVLICEGSNRQNLDSGAFDSNYGWFPGVPGESAAKIRSWWEWRERENCGGARFVNHYENHDIATDSRPRREIQWGHGYVDQTLVFLFAGDGVPLLFNGNEFAEANPNHSMFGHTPLAWETLGTAEGQARLALVKRLAELRLSESVFTSVHGEYGQRFLDVTEPEAVTAFARFAPGAKRILVVQNWTDREVTAKVAFVVDGNEEKVSYIVEKNAFDRSVVGVAAERPLLAKGATRLSGDAFRLGPFGYWIGEVLPGYAALSVIHLRELY